MACLCHFGTRVKTLDASKRLLGRMLQYCYKARVMSKGSACLVCSICWQLQRWSENVLYCSSSIAWPNLSYCTMLQDALLAIFRIVGWRRQVCLQAKAVNLFGLTKLDLRKLVGVGGVVDET